MRRQASRSTTLTRYPIYNVFNKLVYGLGLTLLTGQYNTKGYGTNTDVKRLSYVLKHKNISLGHKKIDLKNSPKKFYETFLICFELQFIGCVLKSFFVS